jgi:uncharacterized protein YprB with RNaseH-like and TPR domain
LLTNTFIHLPRVGKVTEMELWQSGVQTWDDFIAADSITSRVDGQRDYLKSLISESQERLEEKNARYFNSCLSSRDMWRLYADFRTNAAFLDIETTGLSPDSSHITMVGILDSEGYSAFVYDENLDDLREAMEKYDLVVTFNGTSFDLPYVEHYFGRMFQDMAHIDLRFALKRAGYSGGLKSIESRLNVGRPTSLTALTGYDAITLWRQWRKGDHGARETLIRYNAEDVASLPALAEIAYNELSERLPIDCQPLTPLHRHDIDLPYDEDVIEQIVANRRPSWFVA